MSRIFFSNKTSSITIFTMFPSMINGPPSQSSKNVLFPYITNKYLTTPKKFSQDKKNKHCMIHKQLKWSKLLTFLVLIFKCCKYKHLLNKYISKNTNWKVFCTVENIPTTKKISCQINYYLFTEFTANPDLAYNLWNELVNNFPIPSFFNNTKLQNEGDYQSPSLSWKYG